VLREFIREEIEIVCIRCESKRVVKDGLRKRKIPLSLGLTTDPTNA